MLYEIAFVLHNTVILIVTHLLIDQHRYDTVHRLCADFPHLGFTLNGGLITIEVSNLLLYYGTPGALFTSSYVL